jgi:hypothetical protein
MRDHPARRDRAPMTKRRSSLTPITDRTAGWLGRLPLPPGTVLPLPHPAPNGCTATALIRWS